MLHDPVRVLAWRFLHEPSLAAAVPRWMMPHPAPGFDRDPLALAMAAVLGLLAIAYLAASRAGATARLRGAILGLGALVLVVLPSLGFMAYGWLTGRPLGQDGGVSQLPLALEHVIAGRSPYGADYSDSILGKQARVSDFWEPLGGNPILRHHAYLPGTHLVYLPPYLVARELAREPGRPPADTARRVFDPRLVNLVAWALSAMLAAGLVSGAERRLAAAACVLVNPLLWWHQVFGANDVLVLAMILGTVHLARRGRVLAAAAVLGFACGTKQLAWPFAPFLLAWMSGATDLRDLLRAAPLRRLLAHAAVVAAVMAAVVAPLALVDPRAFWGDIVVYNVGLAGGDAYPLGGTPGFGFANYVIYFGRVRSLADLVSFAPFYALLVPLGLLLLRWQLRTGGPGPVLAAGSAALVLSLWVSRVVHPNYLVLAATLLPLAFLVGARRAADVAVVPLLLLAWGVELAELEVLRLAWQDAVAVRLPQHLSGVAALLAPRAGAHLTLDPLGLLFSATAAGLGIAYLTAGLLGAGSRVRIGIVALAFAVTVAAPALVLVRVGRATGTVRAQDRFAAAVGTATVREAWSTSFRRDPPAVLEPSPAIAAGLGDPRPLGIAALIVTLLVLVRRAPAAVRPLVVGVAAVSPAAAGGLVYGAAEPFVLLLVVVGLGWPAALVPGALLWPRLAPAGLARADGVTLRVALGVAGLGGIAVAVRAWSPGDPGPGLAGLLAWGGVATPLLPLAGSVALLAWAVRRSGGGTARMALLLMAAAWLGPGSGSAAVAAPLVLLALAAGSGDEPGGTA